jgi:hypothetical protein
MCHSSKRQRKLSTGLHGKINGFEYTQIDATGAISISPADMAKMMTLSARIPAVNRKAWAARSNKSNDSYFKIEELHTIDWQVVRGEYGEMLKCIVSSIREHCGTDIKLHISETEDRAYMTSTHNDTAAKAVRVREPTHQADSF